MEFWDSLSKKLFQIENEIRSDKVANRNKAIFLFDDLLTHRETDLRTLLLGNIFRADSTWTSIFESLHEACVRQTTKLEQSQGTRSQTTLENKNREHSTAIQKYIKFANQNEINVSYDCILEQIFHCFGNRWMAKYFGLCYLQITKRNVLQGTGSLDDIKTTDWKSLLSACFSLYRKSGKELHHIIIECIAIIVEHCPKYVIVVTDFYHHLPKLEKIINSVDDHKGNTQRELIKIVYYFTENLAVDYRYEMCGFTERILGTVIKFYDVKMFNESKTLFFKFLHLTLIIHVPDVKLDNREDDSIRYTEDANIWYQHLRNMFFVTEKEVVEVHKSIQSSIKNNIGINDDFLLFASYLCYLIFWDNMVWISTVQQPLKRKKMANKLQSVFDLIEPDTGRFSWIWMAILNQMLHDYSTCFTIEDYQPLLRILVDFQPTIKFADQVSIIRSISKAVLTRQTEFLTATPSILNEQFCSSQWEQIAETSFRISAMRSLTPIEIENAKLLETLVHFGYGLSNDFVKSVIKTYVSCTTKQSDATISLIITILKKVNISTFENGVEIRISILRWLHDKSLKFQNILHGHKECRLDLISELTTICILSKMDRSLPSQLLSAEKSTANSTFINQLQFTLQLQAIKRLVIELKSIKTTSPTLNEIRLPQPNELQAIIHEDYYTELYKLIIPEDSNKGLDNLIYNIQTSALYCQLLQSLIRYQSMDEDKFKKNFLTKRIGLILQHLEMTIGPTDLYKPDYILDQMKFLFNKNDHPRLREFIQSQPLLNTVIWIESNFQAGNKMCVGTGLITYDQLDVKNKIRYEAFLIMTYFFDGVNNEEAFSSIEKYEFSVDCPGDLFIVSELLKIMVRRTTTSKSAVWIMNYVKTICQEYHKFQSVCEFIVDLLPDLLIALKNHPGMTDDLIVIIKSFLRQSIKQKYGPMLTIKIINNIKYIAKAFPQMFGKDEFDSIFYCLEKFIDSSMFTIQIATIQCLASLFDTDWLTEYGDHKLMIPKSFHSELYAKVLNKLKNLESLEVEQLVKEKIVYPIQVQLYSTVICTNLLLRKKSCFHLAEYCYKYNFTEVKLSSVLRKIGEYLKIDYATIMGDSISYIISNWLTNEYQMAKFPWYFVSTSQNDFFLDHTSTIVLCILKKRPKLLNEFADVLGETNRSLIQGILTECLAYLMPILANCSNISTAYRTYGIGIKQAIEENFDGSFDSLIQDNIFKTFKNMIYNLWDDAMFIEYFGFKIDVEIEESYIDFDTFHQCLDYFQDKFQLSKSSHRFGLIYTFYHNHPNQMQIIMNDIKLKFQSYKFVQMKLFHLFHYSIIVNQMKDFFTQSHPSKLSEKQNADNVKGYFIRDIIYFYCNIIQDDVSDQLKIASTKSLLILCHSILPNCPRIFLSFINYTVSTLVQLIKSTDNSILSEVSMDILNFLILQQKDNLTIGIKLLDSFPNDPIFSPLKEVHTDIKYCQQSLTLSADIEQFLAIDKRTAEGLVALKQELSVKKCDLLNIYKDLQKIRGFSEDCEISLIHRLISSLLYTVQSNDPVKCMEALKCLGELGPADLTTIVLKADYHNNIYKCYTTYEEAYRYFCETVLEKLNNLLVHPNVELLNVVSNACYAVLDTEIGQDIAKSFSYFHLFKSTASKNNLLLKTPTNQLSFTEILSKESFSNHSDWIKIFVCKILELFDDVHLKKVAEKQPEFSEALLPHLVQCLLSLKSEIYDSMLQEMVVTFFNKHNEEANIANQSKIDRKSVYLNKLSIQAMLKVVECIRIFALNQERTDSFDLDYMPIALAAEYCEAHFTAILYAELWVLKEKDNKRNLSMETVLENEQLQNIMKNAYMSIGEKDSISAFLNPIKSRILHLQLNQSLNRILYEYDPISLAIDSGNFEHYESHLLKSGLYTLTSKLNPNKITDINYECAWRLGDWNLICDNTISSDPSISSTFDCIHYSALKCFQSRDEMGVRDSLEAGRKHIMNSLKNCSFECTQNIYKNLMELQMIQQIEDFSNIQFLKTGIEPKFIINKWLKQDELMTHNFENREPILAQRISILNAMGVRAKRKISNEINVTDILQNIHLQLAKECREAFQFNLASRQLALLNNDVSNLSTDSKASLLLEDARLNWQLGDQLLAKKLLLNLITDKQYQTCLWRVTAKRLYGEYMAESRSNTLKKIIEQYFNSSLTTLQKIKTYHEGQASKNTSNVLNIIEEFEIESKLSVYDAIARFADREYNQISVYMKSDVFHRKKSAISKNKQFLSSLRGLTRDEQKSCAILQRNMKIDSVEIQNTEEQYDQYLQLAITNYLETSILRKDSCNPAIFRIISLWFTNNIHPQINKILAEKLKMISTYKFVAVLPQVSARLSNVDSEFSQLVSNLLERCAKEHPHHTIYHLLALANAYADDRSGISADDPEPRVIQAKVLIKKLRNDKQLTNLVKQMENVCTACINFANAATQKGCSSMELSDEMKRLKKLTLVHCPTLDLPVSPQCDYSNITSILQWHERVIMVGGINAPKKIICLCSDGIKRPQLLKGQDDLRQDAVMEQVFTIMNDMLRRNQETNKRKLNIKTYIVIPMSQRSGILQWCDNTLPMSAYLIGSNANSGAHQRYRPTDLSPSQCRKLFQECADKSNDTKFEMFKKLCAKVKPVFHHFFLERFLNPGKWFERRLAYTNSVATTSMIGYILGLGDRHVSNILIDETTAELIHIDFGIAFEQGKCLPTPETIPFRLTRDIVSAFGVSGVDGTFRKACEKTMTVLRNNKTTIITILEVLLYDPLYVWTLTSKQAYNKQAIESVDTDETLESDSRKNEMAERALTRLESKLDGKEEGQVGISTVEFQVQALIEQAMSPWNLCRLFVGWQPYL